MVYTAQIVRSRQADAEIFLTHLHRGRERADEPGTACQPVGALKPPDADRRARSALRRDGGTGGQIQHPRQPSLRCLGPAHARRHRAHPSLRRRTGSAQRAGGRPQQPAGSLRDHARNGAFAMDSLPLGRRARADGSACGHLLPLSAAQRSGAGVDGRWPANWPISSVRPSVRFRDGWRSSDCPARPVPGTWTRRRSRQPSARTWCVWNG